MRPARAHVPMRGRSAAAMMCPPSRGRCRCPPSSKRWHHRCTVAGGKQNRTRQHEECEFAGTKEQESAGAQPHVLMAADRVASEKGGSRRRRLQRRCMLRMMFGQTGKAKNRPVFSDAVRISCRYSSTTRRELSSSRPTSGVHDVATFCRRNLLLQRRGVVAPSPPAFLACCLGTQSMMLAGSSTPAALLAVRTNGWRSTYRGRHLWSTSKRPIGTCARSIPLSIPGAAVLPTLRAASFDRETPSLATLPATGCRSQRSI